MPVVLEHLIDVFPMVRDWPQGRMSFKSPRGLPIVPRCASHSGVHGVPTWQPLRPRDRPGRRPHIVASSGADLYRG